MIAHPGADPRPWLVRRSKMIDAGILLLGMALASTFLYQEFLRTGGLNGVPLDDSWIHFQFANNLRTGHGFSFNPGVPTPGSTSPLWAIILALVGVGYVFPAKILGIFAYLGIGILVRRLAHDILDLKPGYGLVAAISALVVGRLVWAAPSGMETSAFTFVTLLAIYSWSLNNQKHIRWQTSILFGLAGLLRPEGYLFLGLSGLTWLVQPGWQGSWKERLLAVFKHFVIAGALLLPYLVFAMLTTGRPLPNTFYVKSVSSTCTLSLAYFGWAAGLFLVDNPLVALLSLTGLVTIARNPAYRRKPAVALLCSWGILLPVFYGFLSPCISGYYTRYTTPVSPVIMLIGCTGAQSLGRWWGQVRKLSDPEAGYRLGRVLVLNSSILALIPTLLFWAPYYGQSVADIQSMQVRIGKWLGVHTSPGDLLAVNDIGAIAYFSGRDVIDLMGLVSPEVWPAIKDRGPGDWDEPLASLLAQQQPAYLVIFPNWFPQISHYLRLEPVFSVALGYRSIAGFEGVTVVGGPEMVIYRLLPTGDQPVSP